jgi:DNA-binding PadR family transcriptional regulator
VSGHLGELEQLILLALLRLGDEAYGVAVQQEIARHARRRASFGTIYTTLGRLESKGLVAARLGEATAERGGRRKRFYRLLPAGRRALSASLDAVRRLSRGLDVLEDAP